MSFEKQVVVGLLILGGLLVAYALTHRVVLEREPFSIAKSFIEADDTIEAEVGKVVDVNLSWRWNLSYVGDDAEAQITCHVEGIRARASVEFDLRRISGAWLVKEAYLLRDDGQRIRLGR